MASPKPQDGLYANRGYRVLVANVVLALLATLAVVLRIAARRLNKVALGAYDIAIIIALPFSLLLCISTCVAVGYGLGRHASTLSPPDRLTYNKLQLLFEASWGASIPPIKISILLLYYRVFPVRAYKLWAWCLGAFSIALGIVVILTSCLQCIPMSYYWDKTVKGGKCTNGPPMYFSEAMLNLLSDVILLVLPFPMVVKLKMGRARKVGLCGVFMLGGITCIIGIVRAVVINRFKGYDPPWESVDATIWSSAEPCIGTVCACLPCMLPLFRKFLPSFFSAKKGSRRDISVGMEGSRQLNGTPLKKLGLGVAREGEFQRLSDRRGSGEDGMLRSVKYESIG